MHTHEQRPLPPREVVVPLWTDDAGYCKPLPQALIAGEHTCDSRLVGVGGTLRHRASPSLTCRRSSLATSPTQRRASTTESTI